MFGGSLSVSLTLLTILLAMGASWQSARLVSPTWAILARWARWLGIAQVLAGLLHYTGWVPYPYPVLAAVAFVGWALVETIYNWVMIQALSHSDYPLFPPFRANDRGDEWPSEPQFIALRDWLRRKRFQKVKALYTKLDEDTIERKSVYTDPELTTRLILTFLPGPTGRVAVYFSFISESAGGWRLITDNSFLPFGGFYPENWLVERRPWKRRLGDLYRRHQARVDARSEALVPLTSDPVEELNADQRRLEQLNRELGFLTSPSEEEDAGKITAAGRYRLWEEIWTLSYLGRARRY